MIWWFGRHLAWFSMDKHFPCPLHSTPASEIEMKQSGENKQSMTMQQQMEKHCSLDGDAAVLSAVPALAGQARRWHALPVKVSKHSQVPVRRLHSPPFEHSTSWWPVSVATAGAAHAGPKGHTRLEQSASVNPAKHSHWL